MLRVGGALGADAHHIRTPSGERRSAPNTTSSWAWSCAIRVNWTRNSRSALASRWFTLQSDSTADPRRTAPAAEGRDAEGNACCRMANFSDRLRAYARGENRPVLNRTPRPPVAWAGLEGAPVFRPVQHISRARLPV